MVGSSTFAPCPPETSPKRALAAERRLAAGAMNGASAIALCPPETAPMRALAAERRLAAGMLAGRSVADPSSDEKGMAVDLTADRSPLQ